jgi:hypothetical protein
MPLSDSLELWVKSLKAGDLALCFFNSTGIEKKLDLKWDDLILSDRLSGLDIQFNKQNFLYKDLWQSGSASARKDKHFIRQLAPHSVVVLRLTPVVRLK